MKSGVMAVALFFSINVVMGAQHMIPPVEEIQDQNPLKILTPSLQSRKTLKLRLSNEIELYLVSDPAADESSASISVSVGSWNDPAEFPGMAHFCEHMLFLGTKTYPDEGSFQRFVSDHAGYTNAYTSTDRTVYMFSIDNDSFADGFKRFSRFFIDPLFNTSGVTRELHAIDQEFAKNIENDHARQWMIFKETGNPLHPNHQFSMGNASTLGHIPQSALISWYNANYLPSRLHVVVYSKMDMQQLKTISTDYFSQIPKRDFTASTQEFLPLTSVGQKGHITYINPIKDLKVLTLKWELPEAVGLDHDTKSAELVAYALRNSLDNGLFETLKKLNLAESLQSSVEDLSLNHPFFYLQIVLTKQGVENLTDVISKCFEALQSLKQSGIPSYLFDEMNSMSEVNYAYQSRMDAISFTSTIADQLIDEPIDTYPQKTLIATQYDEDEINQVLQYLTPQNCLFSVVAPSELTKVQPQKKEHWLGGEYAISRIAPFYIKSWSNPIENSTIGLPTPNPFIPRQLNLFTPKEPMQTPIIISRGPLTKSYYINDNLYKVPEISYLIGYQSPSINGDTKSIVLSEFYTKAFHQTFSQTLQLAKAAGLYTSLRFKDFKMILSLQGYSEKAKELLNKTLSHMKNFALSDSEFNNFRESLLSFYENQKKSPPYAQAQELTNHLLIKDHPTIDAKIETLKSISREDFSRFKEALFTKGYIESMFGGNLTEDMAYTLDSLTKKVLGFSEFPISARLQPQVLLLSTKQGPFMVAESIDLLGQASLLTIEEGSFSFAKKASQLILKNALSNDFFNSLRTKQQTGYIVQSWAKDYQLQLIQYFLIQSNTHLGEDLISRTEAFLEDFLKDFRTNLPESRFEEIRNSAIKALKEPATNLSDWIAELYNFAFEYYDDFKFKDNLIEALTKLSYEQLSQDAQGFLSKKNPRRLAVIIDGKISKENQFKYQKVTSDSLKGLGTYLISK